MTSQLNHRMVCCVCFLLEAAGNQALQDIGIPLDHPSPGASVAGDTTRGLASTGMQQQDPHHVSGPRSAASSER